MKFAVVRNYQTATKAKTSVSVSEEAFGLDVWSSWQTDFKAHLYITHDST